VLPIIAGGSANGALIPGSGGRLAGWALAPWKAQAKEAWQHCMGKGKGAAPRSGALATFWIAGWLPRGGPFTKSNAQVVVCVSRSRPPAPFSSSETKLGRILPWAGRTSAPPDGAAPPGRRCRGDAGGHRASFPRTPAPTRRCRCVDSLARSAKGIGRKQKPAGTAGGVGEAFWPGLERGRGQRGVSGRPLASLPAGTQGWLPVRVHYSCSVRIRARFGEEVFAEAFGPRYFLLLGALPASFRLFQRWVFRFERNRRRKRLRTAVRRLAGDGWFHRRF